MFGLVDKTVDSALIKAEQSMQTVFNRLDDTVKTSTTEIRALAVDAGKLVALAGLAFYSVKAIKAISSSMIKLRAKRKLNSALKDAINLLISHLVEGKLRSATTYLNRFNASAMSKDLEPSIAEIKAVKAVIADFMARIPSNPARVTLTHLEYRIVAKLS